MTRSSWFTLAYALMLGAAGPLAACASRGDSAEAASTRQSPIEESRLGQNQTTAPPASMQGASVYTDAQVRSFVAARAEILRVPAGQTAEQQAGRTRQVSAILQRHNIAPDTYNEIDAAARTDQALANRVSAAAVGSTAFTDAQLQAFVTASAEIDPLNRQLAAATGEARTPIVEQIRAALARNNLDVDTYNGIAARAQTDQALAARIATIRTAQNPAPPPSDG
jgi:hypothetical protein